jgi:predicted alpha-1,2-mannosidase
MTSCVSYVDPFIGADGLGNCLCGPYLPNSLVRLGPDVIYPQPSGGYRSDKPILRFSHTHVSGTGGGGRYGNIGITPFIGPSRISIDPYDREAETAEPGFYSVVLKPANIKAELTLTPRVGVHRYIFPKEASANLLIDVSAVVQPVEGMPVNEWAYSTGGFAEFVSDRELVGRGDFKGGWGHRFPYSVFFYARFDQPITGKLLANASGFVPGQTVVDGPDCKVVASFGQVTEINLQVGISYVSIAKARASVERETAGKTFNAIRTQAKETWEKALSRILVEGGTEDQKKLFYTLFTRLICMPSDLGIDDENAFWHSGVRHFTDYYCLWDSVRNANSLIGLFDPELEVAMLNGLLDVAGHTGWLPDAWIAGHSAQIQGGSSADILLCEAAVKGFTGIDYQKALLAMRKNNEVESPDPWLYGRHLKDYRDLGYVSTNVTKSCVSRHLEYAYQDWCIGTLADKLGQKDLAARYFDSSKKIWNLWREDIKIFAPRRPDGRWVEPFDPACCIPESWFDPYFYEGTSWQWSFSVHHDFAGLIERCGGNDAFVKRLDEFFDKGFYHSKETILHVPYLYIYAGRPDKTAQRVRACLEKYFQVARDGLKDNEDMGCQSAFFMCSTMGIYPVMGQDLYLLTTPAFTRTEMSLGTGGKKQIIEASNAGAENLYIVSATLNGKPLDRAWLRHREIAEGAVLQFELKDRPTDWGTKNPPPSGLSESF